MPSPASAMTPQYVSQYRTNGWATIRARPASKQPVGAWQARTDEADDFQPGENVGIRLGAPSGGLVDVDLDCGEALRLAPLLLPPTATFGRASSPRSHWVYIAPEIDRSKKPQNTGVELRSTGTQTIVPPSIHVSGEEIQWTDATPVATVPGTVLVAAFGRLATATVLARCTPKLLEGRGMHHGVLAIAGALWRSGASVEEAREVILPALEIHGGPDNGHRAEAIDATWDESNDRNRSGWPTVKDIFGDIAATALKKAVELWTESPQRKHADRPLSDLGNAERLVDDFGTDLRFVVGEGWVRWTGTRWDRPPVDPVDLAGESARRLQKSTDPKAAKWGLQSESAGKLAATIKLARSLPQAQVGASQLDADPWSFVAGNGVIDLRSGILRPHHRDEWNTHQCDVAYDPNAGAPRFRQFLREIFLEDEELEAYALRFLGYSLTGIVKEQVFGIWHGTGSNGKSLLIETIKDVVGSYAQALAPDMLMARKGGRSSEAPSPDVARMRGARFCATSETDQDQRWDESLVKRLTGDDAVVARHLYREPIEFLPTWKIVLAVNHLPRVRGTDPGIWRRIQVLPFRASFRGPKADPNLREKLRAEAPGILALLVRSCMEWQRIGLAPPQSVLGELERYRAHQDVLGTFLEECCDTGDDKHREKRSTLYSAYRRWASEAGEYVQGKHAFNQNVRERGFGEFKSGHWHWAGLRLKTSATFGVKVG